MPVQSGGPEAAWEPLRRQVADLAPWLSAPPAQPSPAQLSRAQLSRAQSSPALSPPALSPPALPSSAPPSPAAGLCSVCRGPAGAARSRCHQPRCYQCGLHAEYLSGLLPDVVVPVAYAQKGGVHATNLWRYKSGSAGAAAAAHLLRALLAVFLHDHGQCVFTGAGFAAPTHVAVVPSGRGRPGPHPMWSVAAPSLAAPGETVPRQPVLSQPVLSQPVLSQPVVSQTAWRQAVLREAAPGRLDRLPRAALTLRVCDDQEIRDLDPARFRAERLPGARILLLDDTWTTGASAVSATAALKLAGAAAVAVIVLGRHLGAVPGPQAATAFSPERMPFLAGLCAVHRLDT